MYSIIYFIYKYIDDPTSQEPDESNMWLFIIGEYFKSTTIININIYIYIYIVIVIVIFI